MIPVTSLAVVITLFAMSPAVMVKSTMCDEFTEESAILPAVTAELLSTAASTELSRIVPLSKSVTFKKSFKIGPQTSLSDPVIGKRAAKTVVKSKQPSITKTANLSFISKTSHSHPY